jgi:hypothetical protein
MGWQGSSCAEGDERTQCMADIPLKSAGLVDT